MPVECILCKEPVPDRDTRFEDGERAYECRRCGWVNLTREAFDDFPAAKFQMPQKVILQCLFRNEFEQTHEKRKGFFTIKDLEGMIAQFKPMDALDKMDDTLLKLEKRMGYIGDTVTVDLRMDYPYYYCWNQTELARILKLLFEEGLISCTDDRNPQNDASITAKGYQRIREIRKPNRESNQCFVAMWFADEMDGAYEKAIKPAIEFREVGAAEPRFKALKISDKEHLNDINDEIIAQIRRSRFMVCDLTGYRGGVYFEAGFAYGLSIDVIYTCRRDWTKEETLRDPDGKEVKTLRDSKGQNISVQKEGVHFDLAHRNRIEWDPDKLEEFRTKLENRIRATIL